MLLVVGCGESGSGDPGKALDGDPDGDGIAATLDNCPNFSNPSQNDDDGDGIGDVCDPVDDRGVLPDSRVEDCDNGLDDDGDGLVDCADRGSCENHNACQDPGVDPFCGDGFRQDGERCDGDEGCEVGKCSGACNSCLGDGVVEGFEACDDGNTSAGDGCSPFGAVEDGFTCNHSHPSACAPIGPEICDNDIDDDLDESFDCKDEDCAKDPVCAPPAEVCDNGLDDDGDLEFDCKDPDCQSDPACQDPCGNGRLDGMEACDDGNVSAGDGCDSACQIERGYLCHTDAKSGVSICEIDPAACGNGSKEPFEECDLSVLDRDGNPLDHCLRLNQVCNPDTCACENPPAAAECGDGACTDAESAVSCPQECGDPKDPLSDGYCDGPGGETVESNPGECGWIACQSGAGAVARVCDGKSECTAIGFLPSGYDEMACSNGKTSCGPGQIRCDLDDSCHTPCDGILGCPSGDAGFNDESAVWCGEGRVPGGCADGMDNDFDGAKDCADESCAYDAACLEPPPPPAVETSCADQLDNDGDSAVDCEDADCALDAACAPPPPPASETSCTDKVDNDGDKAVDCEDADCAKDRACAV